MPKKINPLPPRERLVELLDYSPSTGVLRFRRQDQNVWLGGKYWHISIDGVSYLAHRVIWKLMTGNDPGALVDHIDTNGSNNRWLNLREASDAQNVMNSKLSRASTTGIKGVSFDRVNKKWRAGIMINRKAINLGRYGSIEEAAAARARAAEKLHGEFARHA